MEDPKVFTKPWKINMILYRRKEPNVQVLEYEGNAEFIDVHLAPSCQVNAVPRGQ